MSLGQLVDRSTGQVFALGFAPTTLGRHVDNTIVLGDPQVSRHHAEIAIQGGRLVIRDLGSANGTYVNGQRIAQPYVLNHGDLVRVGQTMFGVELPMATAEQDTLVERLSPPAAGAAPRAGIPWLAVGLGLAALVAVILVGASALWPLLRGDGDASQGGTGAAGTAAAAGTTTVVSAASPAASQLPVRPTNTAIPTIPPPTPEPPVVPPTEAPLAPTDTPAPPPVIGYFRADRTTVEPGQCVRLEWGGMENVSGVTLTDVGPVNPSGRVDVCLQATKTYILKAVGTGGSVEERIQITVQQPVGPIIEYFRVVPSIVAPGGCAQLEWGKVDQATSASIEPGIGAVGTPGSSQVCPGGTTTYILTAQSPAGDVTAETTLHVSSGSESKPVIAFFTANPASLQAGECTTLNWGKVDYATAVTIDNNIGGVATPGSQEVCLGVTKTFVMTAEGPGGTTQSSLTVAVSPGKRAELPDVVIESILFEPNPCYRGQKCKVRVKVRNDGPVEAGHFVVRWAPAGEEKIPVEWDVDSLGAGQERELTYPWIPNRSDEKWWTLAIADLNDEVTEIEEGAANILEQYVTVLQP